MKAAIFQDFGQPLHIGSIADPRPQAGEVVLEVGRCGICGSDLHMTEDPVFGLASGDVLGHEFSGAVVELGKGVEGLKVGDLVSVVPVRGCGHCQHCRAGRPSWCAEMQLQGGGYAQYATATQRQCIKLPQGVSIEDGALTEPLSVALHGVMLSGMQPGDKVLVIGAGPIGLGVAYWARRRGAGAVVVTDLNPWQQERAHLMGAGRFLSGDENRVENVDRALGGPPDIVFECVGRPGLIAQAIRHVRPRGTVVILGLCTEGDSFIPFDAVSKEVKLLTSAFFNLAEFQASLDALDAGLDAPRALISDVVALDQVPGVFDGLRQRGPQCKVLIDPKSI